MRIAFVTPTLHTLGPIWRRDPQIVKLAAPTLAGAMRAHGYEQLRQYDFEIQIFELEEKQPGLLNLRAFFDDVAVDRFIGGDDHCEVARQTNLILDTLEVEEADVFAMSCASTIGIYKDIHAAGNINIAMVHALKQRFPNCTTVMGGMQISPDTLQTEEYHSMLRRCPALDFTAEASGETALLNVVMHAEGKVTISDNIRGVHRIGNGFHFDRVSVEIRSIPKQILEKSNGQSLLPEKKFVTPETEAPEGDHARVQLANESIKVTPWFDPKNMNLRKVTGAELLRRYHLGDEWQVKLAPHTDKEVALLPYIFMEGCNARCAFCAYSMTKLVKQDIDQVIRSLHWMVDTYGIRYFHFLNTNINGSMKYAEAFADAIIESGLDILWSDCANLWALNERVMEKLARSGCIRLTFGLECPSPRMLKYILKGIDVETAHERLKFMHDLGMWNHLLLITGLPTETPEDTRHFVDFLERSKDYVHGYSVSSFYLISASLMGAFPEQFGLMMRRNDTGLLEDAAFDEVGGLKWEDKKQQIIDSTELISRTIADLKSDPKYTSGSVDLELIFWLYDALGRHNKADVVRAYESAFLSAPNHASYLARPIRDMLERPTPEFGLRLGKVGVPVREQAIRIENHELVVPFAAGGTDVEMRLAVVDDVKDLKGTVTGRRIRANVGFPSMADIVKSAIGPNSSAIRVMEKNGWTCEGPVDDGETQAGFRFRSDEAVVDLMFAPAAAGARYFVENGGVGMAYRVREGQLDENTAKRLAFRLFEAFAERALPAIAERLGSGPKPNMAEFEPLARTLIDELEAPYVPLWDSEPQWKGLRHGDRYSRVHEAE